MDDEIMILENETMGKISFQFFTNIHIDVKKNYTCKDSAAAICKQELKPFAFLDRLLTG